MFCKAASEYENDPGNLWAVKGELTSKGLPTLAKILLLHFACNTAFWGMIRGNFEVHVTALASGHLHDLNNSVHEVDLDEDDGSHVVRYWEVVFAPTAITRIILELGVDSIDASIAEVACRYFLLLMHSSSRYYDPALDWLQASFTVR